MGNTKKKRIIIGVMIAAASIIVLIALGITVFLKMTILNTFPKLEGEPEIGKWYDVPVENAFSSDGSEWHGIFRKGTENRWLYISLAVVSASRQKPQKAGRSF
jgi:hypothetical protein